MLKQIFRKAHILITLLVLVGANLVFLPQALATTYLTKTSVILTNLNAGGTSSIIFEFTTSASNTGSTLTIQFPQYTGSSAGIVNAAQTYSTSYNGTNCTNAAITGAGHNLPTSGTITAAGSSTTITFSGLSAMSASSSYCGVLTSTSAVTNPTSPTTTDTAIVTAGSDAASTVSLDIISNDQIVISATVPPTFTFGLGTNADAFTANLSSSSTVGTTGVQVNVSTNAKNGWFVFGADNDATTGLYSATQAYQIPWASTTANGTLSNGANGYDTGVTSASISQTSGSGTISATTPYASSGTGNGAGLDNIERQIVSSTGTANAAQFTLKEYATISSITPASNDYTDTITLVGAGSF